MCPLSGAHGRKNSLSLGAAIFYYGLYSCTFRSAGKIFHVAPYLFLWYDADKPASATL